MKLLESTHAEHINLFLREETPVATTKVLLRKTGKLYTVEPDYPIAKMLEDTADDTVLATVNLYTYLTLVVLIGILYSVRMYLAVFQLHAFRNLLDVMSGNILVQEDMIDLLLQEFGVSELAGKVAVVGEQQHTRRIAVEPANGINTLRTSALHEIHHGLTLLGIVARSNIVLRLVQKNIDFLLQRDRLVMKLNLV